MQSTMMRFPLTLAHIFERAGRLFPKSEIVSRLPDESLYAKPVFVPIFPVFPPRLEVFAFPGVGRKIPVRGAYDPPV